MTHLDTSFLIRCLVANSAEDSMLRSWLRKGEPLRMSVIGWTEFLCGPMSAEQVELAATFIPERLPYTEAAATVAAQLFNDTGRRRGSLVDCMIAAASLEQGARIATSNPSDFRRFERAGLDVVAPVP